MNLAPELVRAFHEEVSGARNVLIGTHLNPDGDALGSALAVSHFLTAIGTPNLVVCNNPAPRNLEFLPGVRKVQQANPNKDFDLGIIVDLDSMERLGATEPFFQRCNRLIVIDHHLPHQKPGDLRIIDTAAPATALILTRLFLGLGVTLNPEIATCLLTGLITDTGSFRFRNTTPESLALAAKLVEAGADITRISDEIFQRKPLSSVRLMGHVLENMKLGMDDRLAWGVVRQEDFNIVGAKDEDTEGFVNEMLSVHTVQIAAILRESIEGRVKCSLRSRGEYDVAAVAREFNGGGHRNAAGCTFHVPLEQAEQLLVEKLKDCLESC